MILLCTHSYGQIYKWVDEHGNAHFSDEPPKNNTPFQTLNIPNSSRSSVPAPSPNSMSDDAIKQRQQKMLEVFEQERQAKEKIQKELVQKKEKLNETCMQATEYLRKLKLGGIYTLDVQGNKVYKPESERAQAVERVQNSIKQHCR